MAAEREARYRAELARLVQVRAGAEGRGGVGGWEVGWGREVGRWGGGAGGVWVWIGWVGGERGEGERESGVELVMGWGAFSALFLSPLPRWMEGGRSACEPEMSGGARVGLPSGATPKHSPTTTPRPGSFMGMADSEQRPTSPLPTPHSSPLQPTPSNPLQPPPPPPPTPSPLPAWSARAAAPPSAPTPRAWAR